MLFCPCEKAVLMFKKKKIITPRRLKVESCKLKVGSDKFKVKWEVGVINL